MPEPPLRNSASSLALVCGTSWQTACFPGRHALHPNGRTSPSAARPGGPVILWREVGERREGLLIVPSPCPFPDCPDRHVDLALYRLEDSVVEVNASPLEVWTVDRGDAIHDLEVAFTASIELDDERLEADPDAAPELLAWLERELRGSLMPFFREEFHRARARTEALTRSIAARSPPPVPRNDPCPCGSGRKYKRCCLGAA